MGLSMEDVRTAVANANAAGPIGTFDGGERAVTIATNDQMRAASQYEPLVIRAANGTVVRLSAIASIEPGVRNSRSFGWYNRQPSILLVLTKSADANVIETVDRVRAMLPEIKQLDSRRRRHRHPVRPHPDHPRQRVRHAAHAGDRDRAGDDGGVPVPAARRGDHRRRRHRPAGAGRHLRADVGARDSRSTTCR